MASDGKGIAPQGVFKKHSEVYCPNVQIINCLLEFDPFTLSVAGPAVVPAVGYKQLLFRFSVLPIRRNIRYR